MKKLILLLAFAATVYGQPACTQLTQTFAPPLPTTYTVDATGPIGPQGPSGTGNAPYAQTALLTTFSVAASVHGQGAHPIPYCWDSAGHGLACDPEVDAYGNLTFAPFAGSVTIVGGGTGVQGIQGVAGPTGAMGSLGSFGPLPSAPGVWLPAITVTAGPTYAYEYVLYGSVSWSGMTNSQWTGMNN